VIAISVGVIWTHHRGYSQRVRLDVHDLDVRTVVKQVEKQTGASIIVSDGVQGKLTLYLDQTPLDLAVELIGRQVAARAGHVFAIYTSPAVLADLKGLIAAQTAHGQTFTRWTNFVFHHAPGSIPRGKKKTNVHVDNREVRLAAMAVSYAVHAQVVTEDGLAQPVKMDLDHGSAEAAVSQLARALKCKCSSFYYLRPAHLAREGARTSEQKLEHKEAKLEALSKEKRVRKEQWLSLSSEERTEFKELRSEEPGFQQRVSDKALDRIRACTPEQIVEHRRQTLSLSQKHPGHGR
jgi:hypothetical protein